MSEYKQNEMNIPAFRKWLMRRNAIISELASGDEVLRFSTTKGFGVIHQTKRGRYITNEVADKAFKCFRSRGSWSGGHNIEAIATQRVNRTVQDKRKLLEKLVKRDGERACAYCGKPLGWDNATIEHVIPVSRGGPDRIDNMVIACRVCNAYMGDAPLIDKLKRIREGRLEKYGVNAQELPDDAIGADEIKKVTAENADTDSAAGTEPVSANTVVDEQSTR